MFGFWVAAGGGFGLVLGHGDRVGVDLETRNTSVQQTIRALQW